MEKWQQSKSKMWHMFGGTTERGGETVSLAACQSYNLDRLNILRGEQVDAPPPGARVCKKCLAQAKK